MATLLDDKPVCCFSVRPSWLPEDAAKLLEASTQFFDRPTYFTNWLCTNPCVEGWPEVPLVTGWREAKPCAKAISAVRSGDTSTLRRSKHSPPLLRARVVPFQDVIVLAEDASKKAALMWAEEQMFGITIHVVSIMHEFSSVLKALMSKPAAVPAHAPGFHAAAPLGLNPYAAYPRCPTAAAPPLGLERPDSDAATAAPGLPYPHALSAALQATMSKLLACRAAAPPWLEPRAAAFPTAAAPPPGLEPCAAAAFPTAAAHPPGLEPCAAAAFPTAAAPPPGLEHSDGDANTTPSSLEPPRVPARYAVDPCPLSDPDVQSYLVARLALLQRERSESAQEQKSQRYPKDPCPMSCQDAQSYLTARLVLLQRTRLARAEEEDEEEEEPPQSYAKDPCLMSGPDVQSYFSSPQREHLAPTKEQELSKRLASMALSNPGATLRMLSDVSLPAPWAEKNAAPVMVVPNEPLVYL